MKNLETNSWQKVHNIILNNIQKKKWKPGDLIPNEVDLAMELGCARTTVNRALRAIADAGIVERKRKAGTRVRVIPITKAIFKIPIIREEIENQNKNYSFKIFKILRREPTESLKKKFNLSSRKIFLYLEIVHFSNELPYLFEERWININQVPKSKKANFYKTNPNEWLISNAIFTKGEFIFLSTKANKKISKFLNTDLNESLFTIKRSTWNKQNIITFVKLYYHKGYELKIEF